MALVCVFFLMLAAKALSGILTGKQCRIGEFECLGNGRCISDIWRCDGEDDCKDGSDERGCGLPKKCRVGWFRCLEDGFCIPEIWRCDGVYDCRDGSDERECGLPKKCQVGLFRCLEGGLCIPEMWRCDGEDDCRDGSDERECAPGTCGSGEFMCGNGTCINQTMVCDWWEDCEDGSDEMNCSSCAAYTCPESGECISWSRVCDGEEDCADSMDEGPLCDTSCGENENCSHKCQKTPQGSKCFCHEGFDLSEDGVTCEAVNDCNTLGRCSHFCISTEDGFQCSCAEGYVLETDQRTCKAVGGEAYLAYLSNDGIRGLSLETHSRREYVNRNFVYVISMCYDAPERKFFWADRKEKTINSYSTDSEQLEVLLKTQQEPLLLRRDWMTKNIYYTTNEGSIACCNGNGSYCSSVVTNVSTHISSFDISPASGFLFWGVPRRRDLNPVSGVIERANMDGSFHEVIVSDHIIFPAAIAVDPVLEAIYWCDLVLGVIESTDFNGFGRRRIVDNLGFQSRQFFISIAVFEDYIYFADLATSSFNRCDKFSGKDRETLFSEATMRFSLVIVHKAAQIQGENRCADNHCPHICLPTRKSFVCKCDDRNLTDTVSCERDSLSVHQSCPEDYCPEDIDCVVDSGLYVCKKPEESGVGFKRWESHDSENSAFVSDSQSEAGSGFRTAQDD